MRTVITSEAPAFSSLRELRSFSGLIRYLALRDLLVRYKQTWIGFGWSVIRPLINLLIFGILSLLVQGTDDVTGRFFNVGAGVIIWQLVSSAITECGNSFGANANLLTKVYFPKIILPLSSLIVTLVDFLIAFVLFLMAYFLMGGLLTWWILLLPVVCGYALLFSFAIGLAASTASVKYRDVKFILPFFLQIFFYVAPVFIGSSYAVSKLPHWLDVIYLLNPLVFIMDAFRLCLFGHLDTFHPTLTPASVVLTFVLLFSALRYYTKSEPAFADYI